MKPLMGKDKNFKFYIVMKSKQSKRFKYGFGVKKIKEYVMILTIRFCRMITGLR